jgi:hypothetical protein
MLRFKKQFIIYFIFNFIIFPCTALPPDSAYYIRRGVDNMPELFLERRRDQLNPKTMEFEYVELVTLKNIHGDIFVSFLYL